MTVSGGAEEAIGRNKCVCVQLGFGGGHHWDCPDNTYGRNVYMFAIEGPLLNHRGRKPTFGWINSNKRIHWTQRSKLTAAWRQAAWRALTSQARIPRLNRVHIYATALVPDRRHRDSNNLEPTAKACVDGIRDHWETIGGPKLKTRVNLRGCLPDDNVKHVTGPDMRMRIERGIQLPTVELAIIDLEAGNHA